MTDTPRAQIARLAHRCEWVPDLTEGVLVLCRVYAITRADNRPVEGPVIGDRFEYRLLCGMAVDYRVRPINAHCASSYNARFYDERL